MNIKNMKYYLTVCSCETITSASEMLNVSQQALSQTIKKIEDEFGAKLFYRSNPIELTSAGEMVRNTFAHILDEYGNLQQELKPEKIIIGYSDQLKASFNEFINKYKKDNPKVEIELMKINLDAIPMDISIIISNKNIQNAYKSMMQFQDSMKLYIKDGIENNQTIQSLLKVMTKESI